MEYNFKSKTLNDNIRLSRLQTEIFEILLKENGHPINTRAIQKEMYEQYGIITIPRHVTTQIFRINQKTNGLIKNRPCFGYYIEDEIKFS